LIEEVIPYEFVVLCDPSTELKRSGRNSVLIFGISDGGIAVLSGREYILG
jgi:hypothetical protein